MVRKATIIGIVFSLLALANLARAGEYTAGILAAAAATHPNPTPGPAPAPSGICSNCNGTGKLGDGTVSVTCPVCDGTGKATTAGMRPTPPVGPEASPLLAETPQAESQGSRRPAGVLTEADLLADQMPTPMAGIGAALRTLNLKGKTFVDIGCGFDCRAGIVAVRDFGAAKVLAIEIDPIIATSARAYVEAAGLQGRIKVVCKDAADVEFPAGAVGFGYLWPETLQALASKIATLDQFASYAHAVPGLAMQQVGYVFVYTKPQPQTQQAAPVQQYARVPIYATVRGSASWNGRSYSHPVCNRPGCSMCAAIRRQLASTQRQVVGYRTVAIAPNANSAPAIAPQPQQGATGHWETVRVKRCNGRRCWYETQRVWRAN